MSDRFFVYSTLTNANTYVKWTPPVDGNVAQREYEVRIEGGANMSSGSFPHFITPAGVRTEIDALGFEYLTGGVTDMNASNFLTTGDIDFKKHMKGGFITVRRESVDPEVAVGSGMKLRDESAPFTPASAEFNQPEGPQIADQKKSPMDRLKNFVGI